MNEKILLIVDPQNDFITGSLPVEGAEGAMNALADYVEANIDAYSRILVTMDWHPTNHKSFKSNGGIWPAHCVAATSGAEVWPALKRVLDSHPGKVAYLTKGVGENREEYSVFRNRESASRIDEMVANRAGLTIGVCGIAGDVCVADTIFDGAKLYGSDIFRLLRRFSPSIDGGRRLDGLVVQLKLKEV